MNAVMSNVLRIVLLSSEPRIILSVHKILQKHDVLFTFSIVRSLVEFTEKQRELKDNTDFLLVDIKMLTDNVDDIEMLSSRNSDRAHRYYVSLATALPEGSPPDDRTTLSFSKTPDQENRTADGYDFIIDLLNMKRGGQSSWF